jgi:putative aldouronate transport system substrate-binding protein
MNKRIISLILAFLMLSTFLFTGCDALMGRGEETGNEKELIGEASNSAMTLSMFVVCEKEVSEETARLVENAFNNITKANFKTQVKLHFATYDNYYQMIEERIKSNEEYALLEKEAASALKAARKAAKAEGVVTDDAWFDAFYEQHPDYAQFRETEELTGEDTTAEQTELVTIAGIDNSYTLSQVKYPDEKPAQIDILWIDSYERYLEYIEREMIERLDPELSGASKKLNEYINNELLLWAKWSTSGTYGIPNNVIIGEYTYLLVNKELAKKYSYNPEELDTLAKCSDFLADVAAYEPGVAPILGDIYTTGTYYWNIDTATGKINSNKFNLLASTMTNRTHDPSIDTNVTLACNNVFKNVEFTDQLKCIQAYKDAGYVVAESQNPANYAIRMIKGGADLAAVYGEDYSLNVLEYPRAGYDEVFNNMLAVSSYTRSLARSMQIITYLNTNSDLRNILQYGVEGVHYKIDDDSGKLVRLNQDYMMKLETTGNVFMAYPEEDMPLDAWDWGKKQNLDVKPYLSMGFDFANRVVVPEGEDPASYWTLNIDNITKVNDLSADVEKQITAVKNLAELEELITKWAALEDTNSFLKVEKSPAEPKEGSTDVPGFFYYYSQWVQDTGLYVPKEE